MDVAEAFRSYILGRADALYVPAEQYLFTHRVLAGNTMALQLRTRGGDLLFEDIHQDPELFLSQLLNGMQDLLPKYRFELDSYQLDPDRLTVVLTYHWGLSLPHDIIKNIMVQAGPQQARQISSVARDYRDVMTSPDIWRRFVLNEYSYPLFRTINPGLVDWERLYHQLQKLQPLMFDRDTFREAIRQNADQLVKVMLKDPSIDPNDSSNGIPEQPLLRIPIKLAAERNNLETLEVLLADPRVDPTLGDNLALLSATTHQAPEAANRLLQDARVAPTSPSTLLWAINSNNYQLFNRYLRAGADPASNNNEPIVYAAQLGRLDMVDRLLEDPRVDPTAQGNAAIILAAQNGHPGVVDRLLQDPRVDPADQGNAAIILAAQNGHLGVVDRLLEDPRVDPADQGNAAIILAAQEGRPDVVDRLLQDPRVDPSDRGNAAIILAAQNGHLEVVDRLLQDPRVDPADQGNSAIVAAVHNLHYNVIARLKQDPRVQQAATQWPFYVRALYHLL